MDLSQNPTKIALEAYTKQCRAECGIGKFNQEFTNSLGA
jgi:hypothetical protein